MSNWIVVLLRNNLELSKRAIESFRVQDIGDIKILAIDNDSSDNSAAWCASQDDLTVIYNKPQAGVAGGWNQALRWLMNPKWDTSSVPPRPLPPMAEYVLVVNNDVVLRPDTYRHLVADGGGFVTAVGSRDPEKIKPDYETDFDGIKARDGLFKLNELDWQKPLGSMRYTDPDPSAKRPHPDFSCYLIRRSTWELVGEFDERYHPAFYEDNDYHVRMHKAGVKAEALELPFLHYASMTIKNATVKEQQIIGRCAEKNKQYFRTKWGFDAGSDEYYSSFSHTRPISSE